MGKDIKYINRDRRTLTFKYIEDGKYSFTDKLNLRVGFYGAYEDGIYNFVDPSGGPFLSVGGKFLNGDEITKIYRDNETELIIFEMIRALPPKKECEKANVTAESLDEEIAKKLEELEILQKQRVCVEETELEESANKLIKYPLEEWGGKYFRVTMKDIDGVDCIYCFKCKSAKFLKPRKSFMVETVGKSYCVSYLETFVSEDKVSYFPIHDINVELIEKEEFDKVEDMYNAFIKYVANGK